MVINFFQNNFFIIFHIFIHLCCFFRFIPIFFEPLLCLIVVVLALTNTLILVLFRLFEECTFSMILFLISTFYQDSKIVSIALFS